MSAAAPLLTDAFIGGAWRSLPATFAVVNPATGLREQVLATLDGAVGNVLTIHFTQASDVERFALEPGVVVIRLPRAAVQTAAKLPANLKGSLPTVEELAAEFSRAENGR